MVVVDISDGTDGNNVSHEVKSRRAESSMSDARGRRLGRRGMTMICANNCLKMKPSSGDEVGNNDSGFVASKTSSLRGRAGDDNLYFFIGF